MRPEITAILPGIYWDLEVPKHPCFLYDFESMGITKKHFAKQVMGQEAFLIEHPLKEAVRLMKCPWCDYNSKDHRNRAQKKSHYHGIRLDEHIEDHGKNVRDLQFYHFQQAVYSMKLGLIRQGYHEAIAMLVNNTCQFCINPIAPGRKGKCALPESARNKMRSMCQLGFEEKALREARKYEWSMLAVIFVRTKCV